MTKSDPLAACTSVDCGEHVIDERGELHVETCLKDLREEATSGEPGSEDGKAGPQTDHKERAKRKRTRKRRNLLVVGSQSRPSRLNVADTWTANNYRAEEEPVPASSGGMVWGGFKNGRIVLPEGYQ